MPQALRCANASRLRRETRLRRLKEFETHLRGFCLYSREFHSPRLGVFL
ncbi:hypothetical protein [Nostoc sp.]